MAKKQMDELIEKPEFKKLGGWLILPTISFIIHPVWMPIFFVKILPFFIDQYGSIFTEANHFFLVPYLLFEVFGLASFFVLDLILIYFLFSKSYQFPKLMIISIIANLVFVLTDHLLAAYFIPTMAKIKNLSHLVEVILPILAVFVWIPYIIKSKRVKNTFTKQEPNITQLKTTLRFPLLVGLRYLKFRKSSSFLSRISIIGICIVILSVLIPLVTMSVINGFHNSIREKHVNNDYHVQIKKNYFYKYNEMIKRIKSIPQLNQEIQEIYPFYRLQGLIKYGNSQYLGVMVQGIRNDFYEKDQSFKSNFQVIAGHYELSKKFRIVIGERLAQELNLDIENIKKGGEETIEFLFSKKESFPPTEEDPYKESKEKIQIVKLIVSGIFKSGYLEYDRLLTFTTLKTAQILFSEKLVRYGKKNDLVTGLGIKLYDAQKASYVKDILSKMDDMITVSTWKEMNDHLLQAFDWEKQLILLVLYIMIMACGLIIYINLNIVVMDKKREIGIMRSFGIKNNIIKNIFIIEGFVIGFFGVIIGLVLGVLILTSLTDLIHATEWIVNKVLLAIHTFDGSLGQYKPWEFLSSGLEHIKQFPYEIKYLDVLMLSCLAILVSILAAYFPARKSISENIATVIRYE